MIKYLAFLIFTITLGYSSFAQNKGKNKKSQLEQLTKSFDSLNNLYASLSEQFKNYRDSVESAPPAFNSDQNKKISSKEIITRLIADTARLYKINYNLFSELYNTRNELKTYTEQSGANGNNMAKGIDYKTILTNWTERDLDNFYNTGNYNTINLDEIKQRYQVISTSIDEKKKSKFDNRIILLQNFCTVIGRAIDILSNPVNKDSCIVVKVALTDFKKIKGINSLQITELDSYIKLVSQYCQVTHNLVLSLNDFYTNQIVPHSKIYATQLKFTVNEAIPKSDYPYLYNQMQKIKNSIIKDNGSAAGLCESVLSQDCK